MTPPARDVGRDIRRILVIRRKALGDALVTMPAVLQLTHIFPRARLDLIIDGPFVPLLERAGDRVKVIAWPPRGGASLAGGQAARRAARGIRRDCRRRSDG